jgi:hypothetical protein
MISLRVQTKKKKKRRRRRKRRSISYRVNGERLFHHVLL